jgi:hypothetical protein
MPGPAEELLGPEGCKRGVRVPYGVGTVKEIRNYS